LLRCPRKNVRLDYKTIDNFKPGLIRKILKAGCKKLMDYIPDWKETLCNQLENGDNEAVFNQETITNNVYFTYNNACKGLPKVSSLSQA
jgi:hypothetical protein